MRRLTSKRGYPWNASPTPLLLFSYSSKFQTTKKKVNTEQHTPYAKAPITERKVTNSKQIIHINRHNQPITFGYGLIYQQITQRLTIEENQSIIPQNNHRLQKHILKFISINFQFFKITIQPLILQIPFSSNQFLNPKSSNSKP